MTLDKILGQVWSQRKSDAPKGERGDPPRVPPQRHGRPGGIEGSAYMTDNWAEAFEAAHVTRSMSRKARNPDNARVEGFFGTFKCDFFECRGWSGVGFEEFAAALAGTSSGTAAGSTRSCWDGVSSGRASRSLVARRNRMVRRSVRGPESLCAVQSGPSVHEIADAVCSLASRSMTFWGSARPARTFAQLR